MNKWYRLWVVGFLFCGLLLGSQLVSAQDTFEKFTIPGEKIELSVPSEWTFTKESKEDRIDYLWKDSINEITIGVSISINENYPKNGFLFDTLSSEQRRKVENTPGKGNIKNPRFVKLTNGRTTLRMDFVDDQGQTVGSSLSIIRGQKHIILLTMVSDFKDYPSYEAFFEKTLKSFQVK
ncbi:MAG: hypothetical protein KBA38_01805 [Negativicutes bacterium]|nr:hypothetical protein [Negativicutes bacterium]